MNHGLIRILKRSRTLAPMTHIVCINIVVTRRSRDKKQKVIEPFRQTETITFRVRLRNAERILGLQ